MSILDISSQSLHYHATCTKDNHSATALFTKKITISDNTFTELLTKNQHNII